ncbi:MAG: RNA-binding S4 domain-containing protein [Bacteroidetes bacterium]|nr:RNA-binding S4 domain-containing protein [Bacteroidota bacterium]
MAKDISFTLTQSFIPLIQLLKYTGIAESGAYASILVTNNEVYCNNQIETRKRYKVKCGDVIEVLGQTISVK